MVRKLVLVGTISLGLAGTAVAGKPVQIQGYWVVPEQQLCFSANLPKPDFKGVYYSNFCPEGYKGVETIKLSSTSAAGGFLVSDSKKECIPVASNPGIGLAGYRYGEVCPDGYGVVTPSNSTPFYIKLLNLLDSWFGLRNKLVFLPNGLFVAFLMFLVALIRFVASQPLLNGVLDKITNGKGTVALTAALGLLLQLQDFLQGGLTAYEALTWLFSVIGAMGLWEVVKRIVRKVPVLGGIL
jgi:hypothetical protein